MEQDLRIRYLKEEHDLTIQAIHSEHNLKMQILKLQLETAKIVNESEKFKAMNISFDM